MRSYRQFRAVVKENSRRVSGRTKYCMTERGTRQAVQRAHDKYRHAEVRGLFEDPTVAGGHDWERVSL